ncbi:MAG: terpene cyclase/mutase family protein [Planctomycetes bacterium]|nr:terpene cyclase/mutase family protein [Planctomycetota bacterium]
MAQAPTPISILDEYEEMKAAGSLGVRQILPATLVSLLVHCVALIALGLVKSQTPTKEVPRELVAAVADNTGEVDVLEEAVPLDVDNQITELPVETEMVTDVVESALPMDISAVTLGNPDLVAGSPLAVSELVGKIGAGGGATTLSGSRDNKNKMASVKARGGNDASEAAVARGLAWLAEHQMPDGSWNIDPGQCPKCGGKCKDPGNRTQARMGATALGILPFLGAGQTHKTGKYAQNVRGGLDFLTRNMKVTPNGGDCSDPQGSLYSHGLCSIALCESYALTQDKSLGAAAQLAVNYISYAQDPVGGGWRYGPRQPGDTSVVGWQLMALKSGHMSHLSVRGDTVKNAIKFLNAVQADGGAFYGYTDTGKGPGTTAVGLLCRMYLGWKRDEPALEKGVQFLSKRGPSPTDIYYNYYATQVLHHYEGELWTLWNEKMRDQLINTQAKDGHQVGSWFYAGGHANEAGGRLYCTSLSVMTLEVYYRHLPLYKKNSTDDDF